MDSNSQTNALNNSGDLTQDMVKTCYEHCEGSRVLTKFADYFLSLVDSSDTGMVYKGKFNPVRIKPVLPYITMYELIADDQVYLRLTGTHVERIWAPSMRTQNVLDLVEPSRRQATLQFFRDTCQFMCAAYQNEELGLADGEVLHARTLSFPMLSREGECRYRLAATDFRSVGYDIQKRQTGRISHRKVHALTYLDLGHGTPT